MTIPNAVRVGVCGGFMVMAGVLTTGCESDGGGAKQASVRPPPTEVRGGRFALVSIGGLPPEGDRQLDLEFGSDNRVSGFAGVNRLSGAYELGGGSSGRGSVRFGPLTVTKMAGPENLMKQESNYLEALSKVDGYVAEGGLLELTRGGQPMLRYRALTPASGPSGAGPGR